MQREGMARAALFPIWGDDRDPSDVEAHVGQHAEPVGPDAVVVADQDIQEGFFPSRIAKMCLISFARFSMVSCCRATCASDLRLPVRR